MGYWAAKNMVVGLAAVTQARWPTLNLPRSRVSALVEWH